MLERSDALVATGDARILDAPVRWIHVSGAPSVRLLHKLGERFGLHNLALEDALDTHQRAKAEPYDEWDSSQESA